MDWEAEGFTARIEPKRIFESEQMPKLKRAKVVKGEKDQNRQGRHEFNHHQQALAIPAVDQNAPERAEDQAGSRAAQSQNTQCHRRPGDFIGGPIERDLLDEVTHGSEQIAGPEKRVVSVAQGVKDLNGIMLLPVVSNETAVVYSPSANGIKGIPSRRLKKTHMLRCAQMPRSSTT